MVIITGITGGLGNFLYKAYCQTKENVIGTYYLNKPKDTLNNIYQLDITDSAQVEQFAKEVVAEHKNITLINCAGISYNSFAHTANVNDWAQVINVNLNGTFYMIRALLPLMRNQNFGRIINLSSVVSHIGVMGTSAYAASKSGINAMIKSIALENAQKGITINNINLGYFKVGMINTIPQELQEKIKEKIALKEFGDPSVIYKTLEYIRQTPYLTGSCIDLNGGLL